MSENSEVIGQVVLDYTDYPGEDLYSEGEWEDSLLEIVKYYKEEDYNHVIASAQSWNVLYHLSEIRQNIADFLPLSRNSEVLEIGAGCGAVTGVLSRKAGWVTCIELSKKRSQINAYRHRERENIDILVGNFQDIAKRLRRQYDYIFLIGVLEYAASYIESEKPFEDFLLLMAGFLKEGGKIVIAIENKLGMKYFAGCREDHSGRYFDGIEGYKQNGPARTFSRAELQRLIKKTGYEGRFYYPYPDYKLPITVYSDDRLPSPGDFTDNERNFDGERLSLFDEGAAFDEVTRDGYFPIFSNSFLLLLNRIGEEKVELRRPVYSKHSNERDPAYKIRTDIELDPDNRPIVAKYPVGRKSVKHLENMAAAYEKLKQEFQGSGFRPNVCTRINDDGGKLIKLEFEYLKGQNMADALDKMLDEGNLDGCLDAISNFADALKRLATRNFHVTEDFIELFSVNKVPGPQKSMRFTDLDFVFTNLIFRKGWNVIDYEWTYGFPIPINFIIFRTVFYYLRSVGEEVFKGVDLYEMLGISEAEKKVFYRMELSFQRHIAGSHLSLVLMYSIFGGSNIRINEAARLSRLLGRPEHPKVYYDKGLGYHEDNICILSAERDEEDHISLDTVVPAECTAIRFDPVDVPCVIKMQAITLDNEPIPYFLINGTAIRNNILMFETDDPQIILENLTPGMELHMEYDIGCLDDKFWTPITFEFAVPRENEGSRLHHFIHGTRPEYIKVELVE